MTNIIKFEYSYISITVTDTNTYYILLFIRNVVIVEYSNINKIFCYILILKGFK